MLLFDGDSGKLNEGYTKMTAVPAELSDCSICNGGRQQSEACAHHQYIAPHAFCWTTYLSQVTMDNK